MINKIISWSKDVGDKKTSGTSDKELEIWIRKVRKFCEIESQTPEDVLLYISKIKEFGQGAEPYLVILSLFCMYHEGIWNAVQAIDSI